MEHFQLGIKFYRAGDHATARLELEAALGLSGEADLLHDLSWTAEKPWLNTDPGHWTRGDLLKLLREVHSVEPPPLPDEPHGALALL